MELAYWGPRGEALTWEEAAPPALSWVYSPFLVTTTADELSGMLPYC